MRLLATTLTFAGALLLPATAASADPLPPVQIPHQSVGHWLFEEVNDLLSELHPGDTLCIWYAIPEGPSAELVCAPAPDPVYLPTDPIDPA